MIQEVSGAASDRGPSISGPVGAWALVVDRSTTGWNLGIRVGNWVDGSAAHRTGPDAGDEKNHLAKVRVAGSNPVVRSKEKARSEGTKVTPSGPSARRSTIRSSIALQHISQQHGRPASSDRCFAETLRYRSQSIVSASQAAKNGSATFHRPLRSTTSSSASRARTALRADDALASPTASTKAAEVGASVARTATLLVQTNPNNIRALALLAYNYRAMASQGGPQMQANLAKAQQYGQQGLQALQNMKKPDGMSDADFAKLHNETGRNLRRRGRLCGLAGQGLCGGRRGHAGSCVVGTRGR